MSLSDESPYDIFSATIDGEYSADEIRLAAEELGIAEADVLKKKEMERIADFLVGREN